MKSSVVFAGSLVLNLALVGLFALQPSLTPAALRGVFGQQPARRLTEPHDRSAAPAPARAAPRKLWPMLASDYLPTLIARLHGAGFPPSVIREIVRAEVSARYDARLRAFSQPDPGTPFWKAPHNLLRSGSARWEEYSQLQRERARLLRELLANPIFAAVDVDASQRRQFGNLSRQQIDAVQRIEDDYADMTSAIRAATHGVLLTEDHEKLAFLAREKRSDLAALLSPAELADYELRSSPITRLLSQALGNFAASETEFRAIFDLHRTMNERFPFSGSAGTNYNERIAMHQQLNDGLRAALGDARFNTYVRETSSDYGLLRRLAERENLPPEIAPRTFDLRYGVSQESMRIHQDANLNNEQKRSALAALAQNTRAQIAVLLGPAAGPTYVKTIENRWLNPLERGTAITFDGGPNRSFGSNNVMVSFGAGVKFHPLPRPNSAPLP